MCRSLFVLLALVFTVGDSPSTVNARQVVVTLLDGEVEVRFREWID